jgi:hypothetical protein
MWEEQVVPPAEAALPSAIARADSASAIHRGRPDGHARRLSTIRASTAARGQHAGIVDGRSGRRGDSGSAVWKDLQRRGALPPGGPRVLDGFHVARMLHSPASMMAGRPTDTLRDIVARYLGFAMIGCSVVLGELLARADEMLLGARSRV